MSKKPEIAGERLPYAELVIRPADPRPIVVTLEYIGGDVEISPGDSTDIATLTVVLSIMAAVSRAMGHVRVLKETNPLEGTNTQSSGDDIPF